MPLRWAIRHRLALWLPRWLAVWLGIRRLSPDGRWPLWGVIVEPASDTGGAYRAKHRRQDPSADPSEPYGSESSSVGNDHGWSGCTMSAGADAIAYQNPRGALTPWGGDLRHRQTDLSGGTDLYDLRTAWSKYGETLTIKTGAGWSAVVDAHNAGRAIVAQGTGDVPGSQTFDGGHACAIAPETHSDGRWLFGDPLASDWQWCSSSSIRSWMERLSSGCYFAIGDKPPADPEPPTPPPAPVDRYPEGYADGRRLGELDGRNQYADAVFRSWAPGRAIDPDELPDGARWDLSAWATGGETVPVAGDSWASEGGEWDLADWSGTLELPIVGDAWADWPLPLDMLYRAQTPASWASAAWAGAVWRA